MTKHTLLLATLLATAGSLPAATYQWDTNGATAGLGGTGTWDTTTANWDLTGSGADNGGDATTAYTFTASDTAQFGGTGGTVTLSSAISIGSINFAPTSGNYTFTFQSGANASTIGNIALTNTTLNTSGASLTAETITLNTGSTLQFAQGGTGTVTGTINLAGGKLEFVGGNNAQFNGTFTGTGDLLMNSGNSFGNKLTITASSLNNTYTGNTTIVNNVVQFNGYGNSNFNIFGTDTTKTVTLTGQSGAYGPTAGLIFNPSNTGATYTVGQKLSLNSSSGVVAYIQNIDGTLRFTGATTITTDANAASAVKFFTQYSGKDIYLDGVVSGSGTIVVSDSTTGGYGNGALHLTNTNNTFTGTIRLTNESGSGGILTLDANGAAQNATITFATPTTPSESNAGRLNVNTANATVAGINSTDTFATIFNTSATVRTLTVNGASDSAFAGRVGVSGTYAWNNYNNTTNGANLALVKSGAGTLTLSGANAYTGGTTITAGTLAAGNASALGTGAVALNGGTLTTSVANVNTGAFAIAGGTLALNGASAGTITLAAGQNLLISSGQWNIDLANGLDQILGSGAGTFSITGGILDLGNGAINYASTYQLISGFASGSVTGGTIQGYNTANWLASLDNTGKLSFTAVPEPSTYGLLGAGALAAVTLVRRRKAARA